MKSQVKIGLADFSILYIAFAFFVTINVQHLLKHFFTKNSFFVSITYTFEISPKAKEHICPLRPGHGLRQTIRSICYVHTDLSFKIENGVQYDPDLA